MALDLSVESVAEASLQALRFFRVELVFALAVGLLYLSGRALGLRRDGRSRKELSPGATAKKRRPAEAPGTVARAAGDAGREGAVREPGIGGGLRPAQLRDPASLVPEVLRLSRSQAPRALDAYSAALRAGLELREVPPAERRKLFEALVTSSIRAGRAAEAPGFLRDLKRQGPGADAGLVTSAVKLCTSKKCFQECLEVYDAVAEEGKDLDRSTWSCLIFAAVEAKEHQRCASFFRQLKAAGQPSAKDYGNMIRCAAAGHECDNALALVREMREAGVDIDGVAYNTALATCVGAAAGTDRLEEARALLEGMEKTGGLADVITYNTLAKGYARAGLMDSCFELFEHMCRQGIEPSQVTYGILLDGCINNSRVDRAAEVYDRMTREGCPMNLILYTTLIKGFARAGEVAKAMQIYRQMRSEGGIAPDVVTFSILIKANCDAGHLEAALRLRGEMVELKLKPDEVIFNNLLGGCVKESDAALAKRLYQDMTGAGVRPSNATFSILIRLYSQCKLLDEAVEMLRVEPAARGVPPEPRLFCQLVVCCLRERQGRRAVEAYRLLLERSVPTAAAHNSMLSMCVRLNMLDTGAELLALAAEAGGRVDERDAAALLEAAVRKRKPQCVDACAAAMNRLGFACPVPTA